MSRLTLLPILTLAALVSVNFLTSPLANGQELSEQEPGSPTSDPTQIFGEELPNAAPSQQEPDVDSIIQSFKDTAEGELRELGLEKLEAYDESTAKWLDVIMRMRRQHTLVYNGYSDDQQKYLDLRDEALAQMKATYRAALDLLELIPHPIAARFVVTVIEHYYKGDYYSEDTYEGAAKLMDRGVNLKFVVQTAARSAVSTGRFDIAKRIYEKLQSDEIEEEDRRLMAQLDVLEEQWDTEQALLEKDPDDLPKIRINTTRGSFVAELYINEAPSTVARFIELCESGFYDGLDFFQVVEDLLALTGDPTGDGSSRPDRYLMDEHERDVTRMPLAGSLVMAKLPVQETGEFIPNSAGTQFAILFHPLPALIQHQTVFGRIIENRDILCELRRVDPHKKKEKNEIVLPPDRILEVEVLNRPEELPEIKYFDPQRLQ